MTIEELIRLLKEQQVSGASGGSSGPPGTSASVSPSGIATGGVGSLIPGSSPNPLSGFAGAGGAAVAGPLGELAALAGPTGEAFGSLFNPSGTPALGGIGGDLVDLTLLGGFFNTAFGGAVPRDAKSSALGSAFEASGNPLDAPIGQYINSGVSQGHVLSESNPSNFETDVRRLGAMLEALTGQRAPGVTATGFNNNPSFNNLPLGQSAKMFRLPPGYEFLSDPSKLQQAFKDITQRIGMSASQVGGKGAEADWQSVVRELIQQGALQKYAGPLGPAGVTNTSPGAIPNVSLPHPLAQNQNRNAVPAPYPI